MASLSHYNGRRRAEKVNANQLKPVRDYSFPHTRFLSLLRHIGFPLRFRTGARAPKISQKASQMQKFLAKVFHVKHASTNEKFDRQKARIQRALTFSYFPNLPNLPKVCEILADRPHIYNHGYHNSRI